MMKTCSKCKIEKPLFEFQYNEKWRGGGYSAKCRPCISAYTMEWKAKNADRVKEIDRKHYLKKLYGLTQEQHDAMHTSQNGCCAICGRDKTPTRPNHSLAVDHDHETGQVRGLLCMDCNRGLGHFRDQINLLQAAIDYLKRAKTT